MRRTLRGATLTSLLTIVALIVMETASDACHRRRACGFGGGYPAVATYDGYGGYYGGGFVGLADPVGYYDPGLSYGYSPGFGYGPGLGSGYSPDFGYGPGFGNSYAGMMATGARGGLGQGYWGGGFGPGPGLSGMTGYNFARGFR